MRHTAVVLFSGGVDSTVLAYDLNSRGHDLHLLAFDYGQQHKCELEYAEKIANTYLPHAVFNRVNISDVQRLLLSPLTGSAPVQDGATPANIVPGRNAVLLSIAFAYAASIGAQMVATAVQGGDNAIFPDCRPEFIQRMNGALRYGVDGFKQNSPILHTPYINKPKSYIVKLGESLGVVFNQTWSCYRGGDIHCGKCGTCVERIQAFNSAGVRDSTNYGTELVA